MFKITVLISAILFFITSFSFAADEITITTYYPSPHGVYGELRLYPNTGPTSNCNSADDIGKLYYDDDSSIIPHQAYVCRQTGTSTYNWEQLNWEQLVAGGYCHTYYSTSMASCTCPAGETNKKDLGSWGYCHWPGFNPFGLIDDYFRPPGLSCDDIVGIGYNSVDRGLACVCCGG
jgi:hypothetical protein